MREILFRGQTTVTKRWIYGFYGENSGTGQSYIREKDDCCYVLVIPETIGQYTGLIDKNGTKIFEGDIVIVDMVHTPKMTGIVEYHKDFFGGKFEGVTPTQHCLDYAMRNGEVEVIGNIHDNPELLKGGVQE